MKKINEKAIDRLEDIRFWLAVLRNFDGFTNVQKAQLSEAYHIINDVYDDFERENVLD